MNLLQEEEKKLMKPSHKYVEELEGKKSPFLEENDMKEVDK